jgi:crotonobetaine/carnitine-CoA ligase
VLATGDFARRDADGYYYFTGRRSDVLKVGGENVSSVEVEAVLAEHPDVAEVAVVGRPDEFLDEVPVAFLVLRADAAPTADRFANWCAGRLAPCKRPRDFRFVTELPRTSVGKIRKVELNAKV